MSAMSKPNIFTYEGSGVIAKGHAVKLSDVKTVVECTAITDQAIGVAQNTTTATGDLVEVALCGGGAKGKAHGTIAVGDMLGVFTDGTIYKVANAGDTLIGQALQDAVIGDLFAMMVNPGKAVATQS